MFNYFETCSAAEREAIAENLKKLYNRFFTQENETFLATRAATDPETYAAAQKQYIAAISALGAIQAVFHELGINFSGLYETEV